MSGERALPGLGLKAFWTLGSNGWKPDMDQDLLVLSVTVQGRSLAFISSLPGSPSNGDIYIMTAGAETNHIAVRDNGAWVYLIPQAGWVFWSVADAKHYSFDGTTWAATVATTNWGTIGGTLSSQTDLNSALAAKAPLASPALTGSPTAPTQTTGDSSTKIATTAFVAAAISGIGGAVDAMVYKGAIDCSANPNYPAADAGDTYKISVAGKIGGSSGVVVEVGDMVICQTDATAAGNQATVGSNWNVLQANIDIAVLFASPAFTGNPTAPTQTAGDNSTKLATTAYVDSALGAKAPLASPALTGTPTAPTQTAGDNSTKLATTAFVTAAVAAGGGGGGGDAGWFLQFHPYDNEPPTTNYATFGLRNDQPVLAFDTTTQEIAVFSAVMPHGYAGGNIVVVLHWAADTATTGTIGWDVTIERIGTTQDIDTNGFATAKTVTAATVPGTAGVLATSTVTLTAGATDTDSVAADEKFRIRIRRDVANDNAAGDAHLIAVTMRE